MKCYNKLDCVVRSQPAKGNRFREATEIAIFIGPLLVATKVMGGRYTQEQGLVEFKHNPKSFTHAAGYEAAKGLRLVA
jgi:hypothetical protein